MKNQNPLAAALNQAAGKEQTLKQEIQKPPQTQQGEKNQQASRQGKKTVIAYLDPAGVRELKILAARTEKTQQDLLIEAVNDLLIKHGMKALA